MKCIVRLFAVVLSLIISNQEVKAEQFLLVEDEQLLPNVYEQIVSSLDYLGCEQISFNLIATQDSFAVDATPKKAALLISLESSVATNSIRCLLSVTKTDIDTSLSLIR